MPQTTLTKLTKTSILLALIFSLTTACGDQRGGQATAPSNNADTSYPKDTKDPDPNALNEIWNDRLPEECHAPARGQRPTATEPNIPNANKTYTIELARWNIPNDATDPVQTTDGINAAIKWAAEKNHGTVRLPAGHYLVGKPSSDKYTQAIKLPGNLIFSLDDDAIIEMAPNDTWNYCVLEVSAKTDVIITGGTIRGERDAHTYKGGGAHDEGHTICIWNQSERVLVENVHLTHGTGDGILIVGGGESGSSSKNIIIRDNEISNHRRQGVSIVGGTNILIENNEIHHISGTSPQFGIDIESLNFKSQDILIRGNHLHANQGGDYVNTDGRNIWFEYNICDQTGLETKQTDGPIVHWAKTDQIIQHNTITVTVGSSNGRWGIIGYGKSERENQPPNYIDNNTINGGGIHMANTSRLHITNNTINEWLILGTDTSCLIFDDNKINYKGTENYKFRNMLGTAQNNLLNDKPFDLPMTHDTPFTNSPPHMW